jgi:hypothetical protein
MRRGSTKVGVKIVSRSKAAPVAERQISVSTGVCIAHPSYEPPESELELLKT